MHAIKYKVGSVRVGMLGWIRGNVTVNADLIYKSYNLPILDYCDAVWNCCSKVNSGELEKLQRWAACIIMKFTCSDEVLGHLVYNSLEARCEKHVFKLVKKCISHRTTHFLNNYFAFNRDIINRTTGQSSLLHLPYVRTEIAKNSFYYNRCKKFKCYR